MPRSGLNPTRTSGKLKLLFQIEISYEHVWRKTIHGQYFTKLQSATERIFLCEPKYMNSGQFVSISYTVDTSLTLWNTCNKQVSTTMSADEQGQHETKRGSMLGQKGGQLPPNVTLNTV